MTPPKKFDKFRDALAELQANGRAILKTADGSENLLLDYPYSVRYVHSYAEDSPFFLGLAEGRLRGSKCTARRCGFVYATPRGHCMACGAPTQWIDLPKRGRIHSWTTCHFGSEAFLKETPYNLALVEFDGAGSLLMVRLKECTESEIYVGMPVEARFAPEPSYSIADVWFVPAEGGATPPG